MIKSKEDEKILILGASGLLGNTLVPYLKNCDYNIVTFDRSYFGVKADLTIEKNVNTFFNKIKPSVIINLVGLTNVDLCEEFPNEAFKINVKIVENISEWIRNNKTSCYLINISTDQVYDGNGLHNEKSTSLKNYYSFSKYAGELAALNVQSAVLRTNFFGVSHCRSRKSITDWIYESLINNIRIDVFKDVLFNPLSMTTLSELIEKVIIQKPKGIYNLGSRNGMSKADFAFFFAEIMNLPTDNMTRKTTDQVTFIKTYRPKNMQMDCSKFEKTIGIELPLLKEEIKKMRKEYNEKA